LKPDTTTAILSIILLAACAASFYYFDAYTRRTAEYGQATAKIAGLEANVSLLLRDVAAQKNRVSGLDADNALLQQRLAERDSLVLALNSTIKNQAETIGLLSGSINKTREELAVFERSLNESSAWFKLNSDIRNFTEYQKYFFQLDFSCVQLSGDYCYVKLACLPVVNDIYADFEYKTDESTSAKEDKLQGLSEFYANKGGDCEDYSLAAKAEINYLKSQCGTRGNDKIRFEAANRTDDNKFYAVDTPQTWGYKNATAYYLPAEYAHPFVLCGTFPVGADPNNQNRLGGHCLIAFSVVAPSSSKNIHDAIADAILVEPQTGFYYASTKNDSAFRKPANGEKTTKYELYSKPAFWAAITDDDYYLYAGQDNGTFSWQGYRDLYEKAELAASRLYANQTN